jgi:hypothetical protein
MKTVMNGKIQSICKDNPPGTLHVLMPLWDAIEPTMHIGPIVGWILQLQKRMMMLLMLLLA